MRELEVIDKKIIHFPKRDLNRYPVTRGGRMRKVSRDQIVQEMLDIIANSGPLALMKKVTIPDGIGTLRCEWEWGWGMSARLFVDFLPNPERLHYETKVVVIWEGGEYSTYRGRTAASLHSQLVDLACRFESLIDETVILVTGGVMTDRVSQIRREEE